MQNLYIIPVNFSNATLLKKIFLSLREIFPNKVFLAEIDLDTAPSFSPERNQYYSTKLIADSLPLTEELDGKVILLVEFDLYVPVFTFVFGEAQLDGKVSVVSLCRLHEEFYNGRTNEELLLERTKKEILHEMGHNYGLHHCRDWDCVMHSSSAIEQVDIKGEYFCSSCIEQAPALNTSQITLRR